MEKRLGQLKGDIPRYLDWNENASLTRGSEKYLPSSPSSDFHGLNKGSNFNIFILKRSRQLLKGVSSVLLNSLSLIRLSVRNLVKLFASFGQILAIAASIAGTSGRARISPPSPNTKWYCGSSRTIGISLKRSLPMEA